MVLIVMKGCAIVYEPGLDLHLFHFTPYCYNAGHNDVIANERMSIPISKRKNNLLSIAMYNRQARGHYTDQPMCTNRLGCKVHSCIGHIQGR